MGDFESARKMVDQMSHERAHTSFIDSLPAHGGGFGSTSAANGTSAAAAKPFHGMFDGPAATPHRRRRRHHHHHRAPDMVFTPREAGIEGAGGPDMVFTPSEVAAAERSRGPDMVFTPSETGQGSDGGPDMVFTEAEVEAYNRAHP